MTPKSKIMTAYLGKGAGRSGRRNGCKAPKARVGLAVILEKGQPGCGHEGKG